MFILDSVNCGNDYTDAATISNVYNSSGGYFAVTGNDAYARLIYGRHGQLLDTAEFHVPIGNGILYPNTVGIKFRNYVAGSVAVVSGALSLPTEPPIALSAGGISTPTAATVTGDYKFSAKAATHVDPAGGTWYLCDGSAVPVAETALIALIGATFPDARGRVPVALGTNAAVNTIGASDGLATVANRRPQHRHSPHVHDMLTTNFQVGAGGLRLSPIAGGNATSNVVNSADGGSGVVTDSLNAPAFIVPGSLFVHS